LEPTNNSPKSHTLLYIFLPVVILISPILYLLLLTQFSITNYPTSIKPTQEFCVEGYFLFPNAYTIKSSFPVEIETKDKITLFNKYDVFAKVICFKPTTLLPESKQYTLNLSYLNFPNPTVFQKDLTITTQEYPDIMDVRFTEEINNNQILEFSIDYSGNHLNYFINLEDYEAPCNQESSTILCDISSLSLIQGYDYDLKLVSKYNGVLIKELKIIPVQIRTAVQIEKSSIKNKSVLQDKNIYEIDITLNKEILNTYNISIRDDSDGEVKLESSVVGNLLAIYPKEEFKQNTTYYLKLNDLTGLDGSTLANEYVLEFSIDDGPKISWTNISNSFSTSGNIVLAFNQDIKNPQNIKNYVKIDSSTNYSYSIYKNQVTINPSSSLGFCKKYTVSLAKGLVSNTSLIASSGATYSLKTTCKRTVSIGTSVQGRSIYAYYLGSGSKKIVFFGSMHGSEANTKTLLNKWVTELENNTDRIPSDKTIIVIPTLNPDGIANLSRFNAHGVDLNRNFDTPSWVTGTYLKTDFYPTGGGSAPFSEPESKDIRDLLYRESPYLTLSYHSAAGYIIPTNSSSAISKANSYSQLSGYTYVNPGAEGSFSYDITGTFEEWAEGRGYSALVVELSSAYYDQFIQNNKAMWRMVEQ